MIRAEPMSKEFMKLHLDVGKFPIVLHHFTGPDVDGPHDHPLPFTTSVLAGGYIEEIHERTPWGLWISYKRHRKPGTSHRVEATTIHRIIELPEGECVTSVIWHPEAGGRRQPRFYRLDGKIMWSRQWDESEFTEVKK